MNKPMRPCKSMGCVRITADVYCPEHKPKPKTRQTTNAQGYTSKWRRVSKAYLLSNPWCVDCLKKNKHVPATDTDHIIPHRGDPSIFWDPKNWQGLCHACHSRKTATEDGGFGNK